jgi:hypothetical protein
LWIGCASSPEAGTVDHVSVNLRDKEQHGFLRNEIFLVVCVKNFFLKKRNPKSDTNPYDTIVLSTPDDCQRAVASKSISGARLFHSVGIAKTWDRVSHLHKKQNR